MSPEVQLGYVSKSSERKLPSPINPLNAKVTKSQFYFDFLDLVWISYVCL